MVSTVGGQQAYVNNQYRLPFMVMRTAARPWQGSLDFELPIDDHNSEYKVYLHFMELEQLNEQRELRRFNISCGEEQVGPITPGYLKATTHFNDRALRGGHRVSIYAIDNSTHPPILNAFEVFLVKQLLQYEADQNDGKSILNMYTHI